VVVRRLTLIGSALCRRARPVGGGERRRAAGTWAGSYRLPAASEPVTLSLDSGRAIAVLGAGHAPWTRTDVRRTGLRLEFSVPGRPAPLVFDGLLRTVRSAGRSGRARCAARSCSAGGRCPTTARSARTVSGRARRSPSSAPTGRASASCSRTTSCAASSAPPPGGSVSASDGACAGRPSGRRPSTAPSARGAASDSGASGCARSRCASGGSLGRSGFPRAVDGTRPSPSRTARALRHEPSRVRCLRTSLRAASWCSATTSAASANAEAPIPGRPRVRVTSTSTRATRPRPSAFSPRSRRSTAPESGWPARARPAGSWRWPPRASGRCAGSSPGPAPR